MCKKKMADEQATIRAALLKLANEAKPAIGIGCLCSGNECSGNSECWKTMGWTLNPDDVRTLAERIITNY